MSFVSECERDVFVGRCRSRIQLDVCLVRVLVCACTSACGTSCANVHVYVKLRVRLSGCLYMCVPVSFCLFESAFLKVLPLGSVFCLQVSVSVCISLCERACCLCICHLCV